MSCKRRDQLSKSVKISFLERVKKLLTEKAAQATHMRVGAESKALVYGTLVAATRQCDLEVPRMSYRSAYNIPRLNASCCALRFVSFGAYPRMHFRVRERMSAMRALRMDGCKIYCDQARVYNAHHAALNQCRAALAKHEPKADVR